MSYLNSIYGAFIEFKKQISADKELAGLFDAIKRASCDEDKLEAERTYCVIEEDWVQKIEKEIIYVAKAIEEDRQFIIQNGEVVPIEKVKKVSNASVRHLARHSNQITHEPEEDSEVIPEKLYMVENLTDFAVYENRFLYMLLCYLRDFIDLRLSEIIEVSSTYRAKMVVKKDVHIKKRRITLTTELVDEDKKDPLANEYSHAEDIIGRIQNAQHLVTSLLLTPLMREVSKVPMIKPPITKTNVLRMNNNFIHAMELYHFVSSYTKKGYRVEKIKTTMIPFSDVAIEEYAYIVALNVFLEYKYGNKLSEKLSLEYQKEQQALLEEKEQQTLRKIQLLKERIKFEDPSEYILAVEERNRSLEGVNTKIIEIRKELENKVQKISELETQKSALEKDVEYYKTDAEDKLIRLNQVTEDCEEKIRSYEEERLSVIEEYKNKLENLNQEIAQGVEKQRAEWEDDANSRLLEREKLLDEDFNQKTIQLESDTNKLQQELKNQAQIEKNSRDMEVVELKSKLEVQKRELDKLKEEKAWAMAQLNGLRSQHNLIADTEDYTSMERFTELEEQFDAFSKFFKEQWSKTKKRIRREILWKQKNDDDKKS